MTQSATSPSSGVVTYGFVPMSRCTISLISATAVSPRYIPLTSSNATEGLSSHSVGATQREQMKPLPSKPLANALPITRAPMTLGPAPESLPGKPVDMNTGAPGAPKTVSAQPKEHAARHLSPQQIEQICGMLRKSSVSSTAAGVEHLCGATSQPSMSASSVRGEQLSKTARRPPMFPKSAGAEEMGRTARKPSMSPSGAGAEQIRGTATRPEDQARGLPRKPSVLQESPGIAAALVATPARARRTPSALGRVPTCVDRPQARRAPKVPRQSDSTSSDKPMCRLRDAQPLPAHGQAQAQAPHMATVPGTLSWELDPKAHPLVTGSEKEFVAACVDDLAQVVQQEGGLGSYAQANNPKQVELLGKNQASNEPAVVLVRSLEAILRMQARTGSDCVFIEPGYITSLGSKKVVQLHLRCDQVIVPLSICWDWDMKLEAIGGKD